MKISGGLSEDGVIVGNTYDKYGSRNPLVKKIMRGFESTLQELVEIAAPESIHEVGCGEGYWVLRWQKEGLAVRGSDFSHSVIAMAKKNAQDANMPADLFTQRSIYDLDPDHDGADLMVCCEVLEHLEEPELALNALSRVAQRYVILSVPREPVWSALNMARGKYWSDFGNTPGHIQRWSCGTFVHLISRHFDVQEVRTPLPWTMLLCRAPGSQS